MVNFSFGIKDLIKIFFIVTLIFFVFSKFLVINPFETMPKYVEPHPTFLQRHVCTTCGNTKEEAEAFAVSAHASRPYPTGLNTVFIGKGMTYVINEPRTRTIFEYPAPKYQCRPRPGTNMAQWSCVFSGNKRAKHDPGNGHYYYREDSD